MHVTQILNAARNLIARPDNWTPKGLARDKSGQACLLGSARAVRFSAVGALMHVTLDSSEGDYDNAWRALNDTLADRMCSSLGDNELDAQTKPDVWDFNEENDHGSVVTLFDETIARLEKIAP